MKKRKEEIQKAYICNLGKKTPNQSTIYDKNNVRYNLNNRPGESKKSKSPLNNRYEVELNQSRFSEKKRVDTTDKNSQESITIHDANER